MKKLILIVILAMSTVSCELFSPKEWAAYHERSAERGIRCYERDDGIYYCKDKYGNRTYWYVI